MFDWIDYVTLVMVLLISSLIGIYFGYFTNEKSMKTYLLGGNNMKVVPIAISVAISHISAIALVGIPSDVYKYGAYNWFFCFSVFLVAFISIFVYLPSLFKLKITSANEYLEKRFDNKTRFLGSAIYILYENLLLPVIIYSPALGLSLATGININLISALMCGICVFYTAVGGLKTVIWTDIFQFLVILVTLLIIFVSGVIKLGGIGAVWSAAVNGQRFDLDPTKKDSFWIYTIGLTTRFLYYYCLAQSSLQKYLSLSSFKEVKRSYLTAALCVCVIYSFCIFMGLTIYANFANCDPMLTGKIKKHDQLVPYYVMEISQNILGLPGAFMAALVCASISTLSSSLNSISGVVFKDFICKFTKSDFSEQRSLFILKVVIVLQGLLSWLLTIIVQHLGEIITLAVGVTGLIDGPCVGLFTLGVLFPRVKANSAFYGTLTGVFSVAVIYFPAMYYRYQQKLSFPGKPLSADGCRNTTEIFIASSFLNQTNPSTHTKPFYLFRITPSYYTFIGAGLTVIYGLLFSFMSKTKTSKNVSQPVSLPLLKKTVTDTT